MDTNELIESPNMSFVYTQRQPKITIDQKSQARTSITSQ